MKIQELAIIFIIIILPISLLLSEYTQFQIQTLKTQTVYDSKLTAATYDAIQAFQLNAINSSTSGLANSKLRDIEASVSTFRNSIMSGFKLNGYTEDVYLNNYEWWWTMTASAFEEYCAIVFAATDSGALDYGGYTAYDLGIRPAVSLKAGTIVTSGNGTVDTPYIVE